jgi:hypothetical protein
VNRREWRWVALVTLVLVIASSLPYFIAWVVAPEGAHFTGLIFNPQDGNSYIAKMRQGLAGSWLFATDRGLSRGAGGRRRGDAADALPTGLPAQR